MIRAIDDNHAATCSHVLTTAACRVSREMQSLPARADVAQLVEQRFRKPQVTGSNPVVGSSVRFHRGFCVAQLQDYGLAGSRLRLLCVRLSKVER